MAAYEKAGCYGLCYAYKTATLYGFDFRRSISRLINDGDKRSIENVVKRHPAEWFRIGTMGDPCHDWPITIEICRWLGKIKTPIVVTKHWAILSDSQVDELAGIGVIVNTSTSPLDTDAEREYRLGQFSRLREMGVRSVLRVVSANFGATEYGNSAKAIQDGLFKYTPLIDNPLRIPFTDPRVKSGDIIAERHKNLGGGGSVSIANRETYIGTCWDCPDQCGYSFFKTKGGK